MPARRRHYTSRLHSAQPGWFGSDSCVLRLELIVD